MPAEPPPRERVGPADGSGRIFDEIIKILTRAQTQEASAAEKVLAGQGDLLNKKIKEIEDKYQTLYNTLRMLRDIASRALPAEQARAELEKREAKLQADRNELEQVLDAAKKRETALAAQEKEMQAKLAEIGGAQKLDELAQREKELKDIQQDFESRVKAFEMESQALEHRKEEVARDWEKLSVEKGGLIQKLDKRAEELETAQKRLNQEMTSYRKRVEEEVFSAFQRSLVDLVRSHYRKEKGP